MPALFTHIKRPRNTTVATNSYGYNENTTPSRQIMTSNSPDNASQNWNNNTSNHTNAYKSGPVTQNHLPKPIKKRPIASNMSEIDGVLAVNKFPVTSADSKNATSSKVSVQNSICLHSNGVFKDLPAVGDSALSCSKDLSVASTVPVLTSNITDLPVTLDHRQFGSQFLNARRLKGSYEDANEANCSDYHIFKPQLLVKEHTRANERLVEKQPVLTTTYLKSRFYPEYALLPPAFIVSHQPLATERKTNPSAISIITESYKGPKVSATTNSESVSCCNQESTFGSLSSNLRAYSTVEKRKIDDIELKTVAVSEQAIPRIVSCYSLIDNANPTTENSMKLNCKTQSAKTKILAVVSSQLEQEICTYSTAPAYSTQIRPNPNLFHTHTALNILSSNERMQKRMSSPLVKHPGNRNCDVVAKPKKACRPDKKSKRTASANKLPSIDPCPQTVTREQVQPSRTRCSSFDFNASLASDNGCHPATIRRPDDSCSGDDANHDIPLDYSMKTLNKRCKVIEKTEKLYSPIDLSLPKKENPSTIPLKKHMDSQDHGHTTAAQHTSTTNEEDKTREVIVFSKSESNVPKNEAIQKTNPAAVNEQSELKKIDGVSNIFTSSITQDADSDPQYIVELGMQPITTSTPVNTAEIVHFVHTPGSTIPQNGTLCVSNAIEECAVSPESCTDVINQPVIVSSTASPSSNFPLPSAIDSEADTIVHSLSETEPQSSNELTNNTSSTELVVSDARTKTLDISNAIYSIAVSVIHQASRDNVQRSGNTNKIKPYKKRGESTKSPQNVTVDNASTSEILVTNSEAPVEVNDRIEKRTPDKHTPVTRKFKKSIPDGSHELANDKHKEDKVLLDQHNKIDFIDKQAQEIDTESIDKVPDSATNSEGIGNSDILIKYTGKDPMKKQTQDSDFRTIKRNSDLESKTKSKHAINACELGKCTPANVTKVMITDAQPENTDMSRGLPTVSVDGGVNVMPDDIQHQTFEVDNQTDVTIADFDIIKVIPHKPRQNQDLTEYDEPCCDEYDNMYFNEDVFDENESKELFEENEDSRLNNSDEIESPNEASDDPIMNTIRVRRYSQKPCDAKPTEYWNEKKHVNYHTESIWNQDTQPPLNPSSMDESVAKKQGNMAVVREESKSSLDDKNSTNYHTESVSEENIHTQLNPPFSKETAPLKHDGIPIAKEKSVANKTSLKRNTSIKLGYNTHVDVKSPESAIKRRKLVSKDIKSVISLTKVESTAEIVISESDESSEEPEGIFKTIKVKPKRGRKPHVKRDKKEVHRKKKPKSEKCEVTDHPEPETLCDQIESENSNARCPTLRSNFQITSPDQLTANDDVLSTSRKGSSRRSKKYDQGSKSIKSQKVEVTNSSEQTKIIDPKDHEKLINRRSNLAEISSNSQTKSHCKFTTGDEFLLETGNKVKTDSVVKATLKNTNNQTIFLNSLEPARKTVELKMDEESSHINTKVNEDSETNCCLTNKPLIEKKHITARMGNWKTKSFPVLTHIPHQALPYYHEVKIPNDNMYQDIHSIMRSILRSRAQVEKDSKEFHPMWPASSDSIPHGLSDKIQGENTIYREEDPDLNTCYVRLKKVDILF